MKERPILFSGPMVRAILARTKTQTRRILRPKGTLRDGIDRWENFDNGKRWEPTGYAHQSNMREAKGFDVRCPYGAPGDRLWVRETWNVRGLAWGKTSTDAALIAAQDAWRYAATDDGSWRHGWRPSIHMPRKASRLLLEVTGVRVERLQSITEEDARAEGVMSLPEKHPIASWRENPWVWVVEFRLIDESGKGVGHG